MFNGLFQDGVSKPIFSQMFFTVKPTVITALHAVALS